MKEATETISGCPVNDSLVMLEKALSAERALHPRARALCEEARDLLRDIAAGRAGNDHVGALSELARSIGEGFAAPEGGDLGHDLAFDLDQFAEVFQSHVKTRNCPEGVCGPITPAPCQTACPAGIDVPTYVALVGLGRYAEALEVIRRDNPFPWVCGLVCTRPCEFMCVRGRIDAPVAIKPLKAFAALRAFSEGTMPVPEKAEDNGHRVAVVGAGPGGMSAAYYLAQKGYRVRIIEALPFAGGMMLVGIPRYRLPREVIDREAALIAELGVEFCFNTRFGRDVSLKELKREGFEAFFFAMGAHGSYRLGIPGEEDLGVIPAIDFLRRVALGDRKKPGKRVVVIGGGNVAIDAARTAIRLGCEKVILAYRRSRAEMPADPEEVHQAAEEGVSFSFLTIPLELVETGGETCGIRCQRAELVASADGKRMTPQPLPGTEFVIDSDAVISAIGQVVERQGLEDIAGLGWSRRGTMEVNTVTMETAVKGVFAAGDAVSGPATVIEAIGGGKRAALAIDRYLKGIPQPRLPAVPVRRGRIGFLPVSAEEKMCLSRPEMPVLKIDSRRVTFNQVELGFSEEEARSEAKRCLRCDVCRRCGKCVSVCRDKMGIGALTLGYLDFANPSPTDFKKIAEKCILCGSCAAACPNKALSVTKNAQEIALSLCGTALNRAPAALCAGCGAVLGSASYRNFLAERLKKSGATPFATDLCEACLRNKSAKSLAGLTPS